MDELEAKEILISVRLRYRAGYGSSDKQYNTEELAGREAGDFARQQVMKRAESRNVYRHFADVFIKHGEEALIEKMNQKWAAGQVQYLRAPLAGNALEQSYDAAAAVVQRGHKAHLLHFGEVHTCCAVDCEPKDSIHTSIFTMCYDRKATGAWIIDPWMNIACPFAHYDLDASRKLFEWRLKKKQILRKSEWPEPYGVFHPRLQLAPLRFEEVLSSGRTTKSARAFVNPDSP